MKTTLVALLGLLFLVQCRSSRISITDGQNVSKPNDLPQSPTTSGPKLDIKFGVNKTEAMLFEDAIIIDLEEIQNMPISEYVRRRVRSLWEYLIHGSEEAPQSTFVGRCVGIAKKIRQLIPIIMIGGGVIITKLAFLVLFSLKIIGLVGLLLLLNVATVAGKLGAHFATKKADHPPQNLHIHVQPWKNSEDIYSTSHHGGPSYEWEDKIDADPESHELYNLYEKLKFQNNLRRYINANRQAS